MVSYMSGVEAGGCVPPNMLGAVCVVRVCESVCVYIMCTAEQNRLNMHYNVFGNRGHSSRHSQHMRGQHICLRTHSQ